MGRLPRVAQKLAELAFAPPWADIGLCLRHGRSRYDIGRISSHDYLRGYGLSGIPILLPNRNTEVMLEPFLRAKRPFYLRYYEPSDRFLIIRVNRFTVLRSFPFPSTTRSALMRRFATRISTLSATASRTTKFTLQRHTSAHQWAESARGLPKPSGSCRATRSEYNEYRAVEFKA